MSTTRGFLAQERISRSWWNQLVDFLGLHSTYLLNAFSFCLAVLEDLAVHLEGKDTMKEMKFIILEQKFLEFIYAAKTFEALKVLQLEIR